WLRRRRDEWSGSGQPWEDYLRGWAGREGLHSGQGLLRELTNALSELLASGGRTSSPSLTERPRQKNSTQSKRDRFKPRASTTSGVLARRRATGPSGARTGAAA